jgi:predicted 3-demethylubiquinone-9 3-methyltransferase (glyoxalase superfamily)
MKNAERWQQLTFSEAISFFVSCETQPEIDELWEKPSDQCFRRQCFK